MADAIFDEHGPEANLPVVPAAHGLKYRDGPDREEYSGTKLQLQAIGLGCGARFPSEEGGPRRHASVTDALGRKWSIYSQRWKGPDQYRAERRKTSEECDAWLRLYDARKALEHCVTDPQKVTDFSVQLVNLARRHLAALVSGPLFPGVTASLRMPREIRSWLVDLVDELDDLAEEIVRCEMEPNPDGIAKRENLQRTVELYSNPAFVGVLGKKASKLGAAASTGGR